MLKNSLFVHDCWKKFLDRAMFPNTRGEYGISPQADIEYYINANNVNLRSGAGTEFSSGGQVNYGDILTLRSVYDSKQNKTTFVHYDSNDAKWYSVHMVFGNCRGLNGYVFATYVSSRTVDRIEY